MRLQVRPFVLDCTNEEQADKVLEEAAEAFAAWQLVDKCRNDSYWPSCDRCDTDEGKGFCHGKMALADELADVVQAACNLAERYGVLGAVCLDYWPMAAPGPDEINDKALSVLVLRWAASVNHYAPIYGTSYYSMRQTVNSISKLVECACDLATRYVIDIQAALLRCEERNERRGRYGA